MKAKSSRRILQQPEAPAIASKAATIAAKLPTRSSEQQQQQLPARSSE